MYSFHHYTSVHVQIMRYDYKTNHRKPPQTTANHPKPPQTTANHRKPPPEFGTILTIGSENSGKQANHRQNLGQKQIVWLLQSSQALSVEHDAFANSRNIHRPKSCIFTLFLWWFVVICVGWPCDDDDDAWSFRPLGAFL